MYKLLRRILFLFSPEWVHYFSMNCLKLLCSVRFIRKIIAARFIPKGSAIPHSEICNLKFKNPVGLGAGFDKNARYMRELEALGFGFIEVGTVTPLPQAGNEKPRLFRLPKDNALLNRMGFNNDGVKVVAERLKKWKKMSQSPVNSRQSTVVSQQSESKRLRTEYCKLIIGGNIGKNKKTPNEEAWKDYEICFKELHPYVDYFVVNVSSPNTPGLRELQEKESLRKILTSLQKNNAQQTLKKPILLKISPDLTRGQIDDVIALALEIKLDGIVATNTTINRLNLGHQSALLSEHIGTGGLSGAPLKDASTEIVKYIHQKSKGEIPVIASGGIITAEDALEKFEAGAALVQVWTGFIYEGPSIIKQICEKLKTFTLVTTASK
jgi:dihydroorotate dehydrogenase